MQHMWATLTNVSRISQVVHHDYVILTNVSGSSFVVDHAAADFVGKPLNASLHEMPRWQFV